jgi:hypothetical protein
MSYSLSSKSGVFRVNENEFLRKKISFKKNSCKICNSNIDLIKCTKCSFYFCKQCITKKFNINNIAQQIICKFCIDNEQKNLNLNKLDKVEPNPERKNGMKKKIKEKQQISFKNVLNDINDTNNNMNNMNNIPLSESDNSYSFNEKENAILPLKYQLYKTDFSCQNPNENYKNGKISPEYFNENKLKNEKDSYNNLFSESFINHQKNTNQPPNFFFQNICQNIYSNRNINSQNIFNIYNNNNIISFPFQNLNVNMPKDTCINNVNNLNDILDKIPNPFKNINFEQNSDSSIKNSNEEDNDNKYNLRYMLKEIFSYLYNYDRNNLDSNFEILSKMESLASQFSELADLKNDKNIDNNTNKDNNLKEKINYIQSMNETLRNQLKNLKTYIDIERIFISIIYQNLNQFVKDLEATGKNDNNIRMQTTKKGKQKKNNKRSDNKKQNKRCN